MKQTEDFRILCTTCIDFMQRVYSFQAPFYKKPFIAICYGSVILVYTILKQTRLMLYSYKGRVEYKNPNEMCSFINEYISNCIFTNAEHLDIYFCVMNDCVNIYRKSVKCFNPLQTKRRPLYLTLRSLTLYIYGAPILDVSRSHTTTQHSR